MGRFVSLIFKNSWRNKRRTTLTVLSIGVSLCLVGVLLAVYHAFYFSEPPPHAALRLITRNRVSLAFAMPIYYRDKIRQVPGVREVGLYQWFGGAYKDSRDPKNFFARFAIEPEKLFTIRGEMRVPEDQKKAFIQDQTGCMVGRRIADQHGFQPGDRITFVGDIFPVTLELTIRAIFDAPDNDEVAYFHWKYLQEAIGPQRGSSIGTFGILAESAEAVPRIAQAVDEMFRNATVQTRTESEQQFGLSFLSFLGNVKAFLLSICAAVTFTILLVSANTMAMSVRERVREVGILKTLGFTTRGVMGIVLGEAVILSVAGGVLGLLLAGGLCAAIRNGPLGFPQLRELGVEPSVAAVSLALAALIGVSSAVLPAWVAARTSIVEAIRHSG